jgi:hypothetical protein
LKPARASAIPPSCRVGAASRSSTSYVIRENRTYDQVFGDIPESSDPELCLFGEDVTPNAHALARDFVLLDNFYVNAEVSYDGPPIRPAPTPPTPSRRSGRWSTATGAGSTCRKAGAR